MTQPVRPAAAPAARTAGPEVAAGLAWVSWLRVLAITAVVLIHTAGLTAVAPDARETLEGQLAIALDFSSRWAVPVFVMLSGAVLLDPARYRGTGDFLRRRAIRLVPAVVVWHLVYLGYRLVFTDSPDGLGDLARLVLTGKLWTALYFFWIILGLAVITPVLLPWIASTARRTQLAVGLVAAMVPALTLFTVPIRTDQGWHADMSWVETPWTWWVPYLGYYLLGYALRGVVLKRGGTAVALATFVTGSALLSWQWAKTEGVAGWIERYMPAEAYYSPTTIVIVVSVFLLGQTLVRSGGLLDPLCRPGPAIVGRRLGDATLGVFAVHLLVLEAVLQIPVIGGSIIAGSAGELVARCVVVLVVAYLISLLASRIPFLSRVF